MPASTKFIPDSEVIVPVSDDVFNGTDARFAVGSLGYGSAPEGNDEIFDAYLKLRKNVYIDQTRSLSPDVQNFDGTETDEDDERSHHFALVENMLGRAAVVASIRLIHKSGMDVEPLPIEKFYPETFGDNPAPLQSTEASRLVVRTPETLSVAPARRLILGAALSHILVNELGPTYAVLEKKTYVGFNRTGIKAAAVTAPVYNAHYDEVDLGTVINTDVTNDNFGGNDHLRATYIEPGTFMHSGEVRRAA